MKGVSLEECQKLALNCDVPVLAWDQNSSECWLFKTALQNVTAFQDFVHCEKHVDFIPGYVEFALTIIYGLATLVFAGRLLGRLAHVKKTPFVESGVWLSELPCEDREDGEPFLLGQDQIQRVAQDLKQALEERVERLLFSEKTFLQLGGDERGRFLEEEKVLAVHVLYAPDLRPSWGRRFTRQLSGRFGRQDNGVAPTGSFRPAEPKKRLAGHAFAVMARGVYAALLLQKPKRLCSARCLDMLPQYVQWHSYTLFKFGVPPWSAVTLRCQRAPPASDVIWENLHVKWHRSLIVLWLFRLLLFLFSLCLVAPASLAAGLYEFVGLLHKASVAVTADPLPPTFWNLLGQMANNVPSYFLLFTNSVLFPLLIQLFCDGAKPHLRSRSEATQFTTMLFYLLLNSFLVPLLGFLTTSQPLWKQALSSFKQLPTDSSEEWLKMVGQRSRLGASLLILKYTANAAFVTSGCQLIQLGKGIGRRCVCMPDEPWAFAWGYWYAWSMSVLVVSLVMGVVMPTQLLLAVLFFWLTKHAHRDNFENQVFDVSFDMDGDAEISIACTMVKATGIFWTFMALFFFSQPVGGEGDSIDFTIWLFSNPWVHAEKMTIPETPLVLPVKLVHFGEFMLLAIGLGFASRLFAPFGMLEKQTFRRLGTMGQSVLKHTLEALSVLLLLAGSITCRPHLSWKRVEVPLQKAAAAVLLLMACWVFLAAVLVEWWGKRKARNRGVRDAGMRLKESSPVNLADLMGEEGMGGMLLASRHAHGREQAASFDTGSGLWRLSTETMQR